MDRNWRMAAVGAALIALVLVFVYGPMAAAFMVAGVAFVVMFSLMGMEAAHAIGQWRLAHPWARRHRRTRTKA